MTEENRRTHIAAEVAKGVASLSAAEALLKLGLYDDAVARFYYAVFHFASAALLAVDVSVTSHRALLTQFSLHVVRPGTLPAHTARDLKQLQSFREAADYDRGFSFDLAGANEQAEIARRFVALVREHLAAAGWLTP